MKASNIIIRDENKLAKKISKMKEGGASMLHVVSDFDRTLTRMAGKGHEFSTSYDCIDKGLGFEFEKQSKMMAGHYLPIEMSKSLSVKYKSKKMNEWWENYFELAIKHGMCKEIILGPVKKLQLDFRQGAIEFLKMLSKEKIPLLIFSAGAGDIIHESLKKNKLWASNIHIVSNFFKYDTSGKAVSYTMPLIHPFNKNESCVKKSKYKSQIAKRKNVILLGDSLGDLTMAKGMKHDCIIKIGFYNHEYDKERISKHKKGYDVIITGNKDMRYANWLLKEIIKG